MSWAICPTTRAPLTCSSRSSAGATNGKVWSSRRTWRFRTGRPSSPTRAVPSRSSIASSTTPRSSPSRARVTAGAPPRSPARPPAPSRRRRDPRRRSKFPPFSEFGNKTGGQALAIRSYPERGPARRASVLFPDDHPAGDDEVLRRTDPVALAVGTARIGFGHHGSAQAGARRSRGPRNRVLERLEAQERAVDARASFALARLPILPCDGGAVGAARVAVIVPGIGRPS